LETSILEPATSCSEFLFDNFPYSLNEETLSEIDDEQPQVKKDKKTNYLKIFIVIIITFVAIIIIIETFKHQISFIYPDIETLLSNLYESLRDINLFLRDLIK